MGAAALPAAMLVMTAASIGYGVYSQKQQQKMQEEQMAAAKAAAAKAESQLQYGITKGMQEETPTNINTHKIRAEAMRRGIKATMKSDQSKLSETSSEYEAPTLTNKKLLGA